MADFRLAAMVAANAAFAEAGARFDRTWVDLVAAADAETAAQDMRERAYSVAMRSGFIFESVLDPERVTYFAGYEGGEDGDQIHPELDEAHAESLKGAFAHTVEILMPRGDRIDSRSWRTRPTSTGTFGSLWFSVDGIHTNAEVPGLAQSAAEALKQTHTRYFAALEAIEWRIATDDEVAKFGNRANSSQ